MITNSHTNLTLTYTHINTWNILTIKGFDPLGDVLKPVGSAGTTNSAGSIQATQLQIIPGAAPGAQQPGKVLTGDLDSSLASLAENLTINKSASSSMKWVFQIEIVKTKLETSTILQRRAMELTQEPGKTTKLVTTANGDYNRRQLSADGEKFETVFWFSTFVNTDLVGKFVEFLNKSLKSGDGSFRFFSISSYRYRYRFHPLPLIPPSL